MSLSSNSVVGLSLAMMVMSVSCAHQQTGPEARGLLRLEVEPASATVFVDEDYMGQIDGWVQQTIPLTTGVRMVEISAPGYMSQRFDVEIRSNEEVTLRLRMEPELEVASPEQAEGRL